MSFSSNKGSFLVANSTLQDPSFANTVVLIIEHDENGAFGLVVNRASDIPLSKAIENLPAQAESVIVFEGGPVKPEALFILHADSTLKEKDEEIIENVFLSSEKETLETLIVSSQSYHIYHGYSGWGAGQLEAEIEANSWLIVKARADIIFNDNPENVWREALAFQGGLYEYFANNVRDPFMN